MKRITQYITVIIFEVSNQERERERERKKKREREREGERLKAHHLPDGKRSDIFDPDGYIEHLRCYELSMTRPLKFGHLNQHGDVPRQTERVWPVNHVT